MGLTIEILSNRTLEKSVKNILEIRRDGIHILGNEFSVLTDDKGNFMNIKGIKLDEWTSSKLTSMMWSLNFLYASLQKSKDQFGTAELRKTVVRLLTKILTWFSDSNSLQDLISVTKNIEKEQNFLKDGKIDSNCKLIILNQSSRLI
ncbi:hypothetical protein [uncultured Aquimarina sp.]|uniref:hypothetical protein n=1 Tax=uncultured Aquimarina sp. TaxID=575652 RepID=UPI00262BAE08|nr:hypothetical protein [uncultured Aquimarina sp.]